MSKIICDVCGTTYPETAAACPICGCARPGDATPVVDENVLTESGEQSGYTYVKGGRFSKKNVRKRLKANGIDPMPISVSAPMDDDDDEEDAPIENERSTKGLTIAVLALLTAIVGVVIYLAVRFFMPDIGKLFLPGTSTVPTTTVASTVTTTVPSVPCTALTVDDTSVTLTFIGDSWKITATAEPADTTDEILFYSSNETVATVSASGEIRSVGEGSVVITVVCGDQSAQCYVDCTVETLPPETTVPETIPPVTEPVTEPTTPPTTEPTTPATDPNTEPSAVHTSSNTGKYKIRINGEKRKDYDVSVRKGDSIRITLVDGNGNQQDVTWTASNSRATVSGNKITFNSSGLVYISCVVEGEKYSCIIRIS
jgi:hypothetical protein